MGKKGAGTSGKAKSSQEDTQESDGLRLTGVLSSDVALLCDQDGLPPISVKPLHPPVPVEDSSGEVGEGEVPSSRFHVLADWEDPDDQTSLRTLIIRGWLVSERVLNILTEALASYSHLSTINLWNVGLTPVTLRMVTALAVQHSVSELCLDGNSLTPEPIVDMLRLKSSVELLSLKCCSLTDPSLSQLSSALTDNKTLLHLDLSCNGISNEGVVSLSAALRLNRTLLSLTLTNNKIGDRGASALAEVLSEFPLNHEEVVMKRKMDSAHAKVEDSLLDVRETSTGRSPSVLSVDKKGGKAPASRGKKDSRREERGKKDDKTKKGSDSKKGGGRDKASKDTKKGVEVPEESTQPESTDLKSPLLEAKKTGDQWYLPGNSSLTYLGLAYNNIGEAGVHSLLSTLQYQQSTFTQSSPGLLNLSIHHNALPSTHTVLCELVELVEGRDPLIRTATSETTTIEEQKDTT